jgi:hypothetical protein
MVFRILAFSGASSMTLTYPTPNLCTVLQIPIFPISVSPKWIEPFNLPCLGSQGIDQPAHIPRIEAETVLQTYILLGRPKLRIFRAPFYDPKNADEPQAAPILIPTRRPINHCRPPQLIQLCLIPDLLIPPRYRPSTRQRRKRWERPPLPTLPLLVALQITQPKSLTITLFRIRAMHCLLPENQVPTVLQHSPADMII